MPKIDFEPVGRRGDCPDGSTILDGARLLRVGLANLCGGKGSCGRCVVQVLRGEMSEPSERETRLLTAEQLAQGYRLACLARPLGDCRVRVPPESLTAPQRTQVEGEGLAVQPDPIVKCYFITVPPPTIHDLRSDERRLVDALRDQHGLTIARFDLSLLQGLSPALREGCGSRDVPWLLQAAVRGDEVVAVLPPAAPSLGIAVDIGTTKVAVFLVDLVSGKTLASEGMMNPQIAYGEDVIARMALADTSPDQAAQMQSLLVEALNGAIERLTAQVGSAPAEVLEMVAVANTAIHHLFVRLPVRQLALAPYVPAASAPLDLKARDMGLALAPGAYLHLLPNIAGYVGADHVAMLLATRLGDAEDTVLALDIGTNTEVCLVSGGRMLSTSCASGPAFEGAHIKHGMRAANGAIERVSFVDGDLRYQTIGDEPAVGLCGSGALDALAELFLQGIVDERGRMREHPRVSGDKTKREFLLAGRPEGVSGHPAITFTQRDVSELLLAKGAMRTGVNVLMKAQGVRAHEIDRVILAGAFGTYIDVHNAMVVGMLPEVPVERVTQVGNAAGMGARMALISRSKRAEAAALAQRVGYVELAADPDFSRIFAGAMYLGARAQRE
ncbi:MAG TPA: ASKHA domain-containing protein [Anaerolineae bacterium]|nr:ASKHA domain-containing protein [Anaerolineae bacterium]